MKTKLYLAIQFFGIIGIVSCSKDDVPFDYVDQPISAPTLRHVVDSIYMPFFTSGNYDFNDHITSWGYQKGKFYITTPVGIKLDSESTNMLTWDPNLDLGNYPITLTAQNSKGSAEDKFVLVLGFGGTFVRTYNHHPEFKEDMSLPQLFYFDFNGVFQYDDPWDYGNSIKGNWAWASKNEIQGSYAKHGQLARYSFKVNLAYDEETGLPQLNGYWYEGTEAVAGKEKGQIKLYKDDEFSEMYKEVNWPQIYSYSNPIKNLIDKDKFAGWFTARCYTVSDSTNYRLYLGTDKRIFRGKENSHETWSWLSDNEIQGTFMEHQDFEGSEEKFITFRGGVSAGKNGLPIIEGHWYLGKEVIEGEEAGAIKLEYENWEELYGW